MRPRHLFTALAVLCCAYPAAAQVAGDSVNLAKLKISEAQKSTELCPVHLVPSDPALSTWTHNGTDYRGHSPECQAAFEQDPGTYAEMAALQRWTNNFVTAMSTIWCPLMDEVNPGGLKQWVDAKGVAWESCCAFCDEAGPGEEEFDIARVLLLERAEKSYALTGGKYVEGASSPVERAMPWHKEETEEPSG